MKTAITALAVLMFSATVADAAGFQKVTVPDSDGKPRDVGWIVAATLIAFGAQELTRLVLGEKGSVPLVEGERAATRLQGVKWHALTV